MRITSRRLKIETKYKRVSTWIATHTKLGVDDQLPVIIIGSKTLYKKMLQLHKDCFAALCRMYPKKYKAAS